MQVWQRERTDLTCSLGEKWRHSRNWMAPQLTHAKINKAKPVVAKHVVTLRNALKEKSDKMEDVNRKWFPDLHQAALSENCSTTVHYNPNDVTNDITCLREYAFSIMLDFAFAHGKNITAVFNFTRSLIP